MGQMGRFRTSMNGFNKQDVLQYLDELSRQEYGELEQTKAQLEKNRLELAVLRQQLAESEIRATRAEEDTRTLQAAIDDYVQTAREKSAETEELLSLRREKQMWRVKESSLSRSVAQLQQENAALRQQAGNPEELAVLRRQLEEAQKSAEQNRALVETMSGFLEEMRRIEQESLRICCGKSDEELQTVYDGLERWEQQLACDKERVLSLRRELREQRADADGQLEKLAQELHKVGE